MEEEGDDLIVVALAATGAETEKGDVALGVFVLSRVILE